MHTVQADIKIKLNYTKLIIAETLTLEVWMCLKVVIVIKKIVFPCRLVKQVLNVNVIGGKAWIGM